MVVFRSAVAYRPRHPFLLPNLVAACCAFVIIPFVVVYLPETRDLRKGAAREDVGR